MMDGSGGSGHGGAQPVNTELAAASEALVRAIRAHADAVGASDDAGARTARAAISSAKWDYSLAVGDLWNQVSPFPVPPTLREAPQEVELRVTYHLQVLDESRLTETAQEVGCDPVTSSAEAVAALYGDQHWWPGEETGLACVVASYGGGFEPA